MHWLIIQDVAVEENFRTNLANHCLIIMIMMCMMMMMMIMIIIIFTRLHNEGAGGAWCPREPVSREKDQQWIQVTGHDDCGDFDGDGGVYSCYGGDSDGGVNGDMIR